MKELFIVANWKSNKTEPESIKWIQEFSRGAGSSFAGQISNEEKEIIICPPFTLLCGLKSSITENQLPFKVGAQDISPFENGAYTGEICGNQIKEFADYVIIGHSERRKNFGESDETIVQKLKMAEKYKLTPILCISELEQIQNLKLLAERDLASQDKSLIIAYEPLFAIGSGIPDTPENAEKMALEIKANLNGIPVLYGGSVTSENIKSFTQMQGIDGVLVGGASLDPLEFSKIVEVS